jgi:hypothetical protein
MSGTVTDCFVDPVSIVTYTSIIRWDVRITTSIPMISYLYHRTVKNVGAVRIAIASVLLPRPHPH